MTEQHVNHETMRLVKRVCESLEDKKAIDLKLLNVNGKSSVTNYFILASGTSEPHLKALRREIENVLREEKAMVVGSESAPDTGWVVVDAFDFMVHLFLPETRRNYNLETLWRDADEVAVEDLMIA